MLVHDKMGGWEKRAIPLSLKIGVGQSKDNERIKTRKACRLHNVETWKMGRGEESLPPSSKRGGANKKDKESRTREA